LPTNIDDYIHRIGRTGRCGNKGNAVSFISEKSKPIMKDLLKILQKHKQNIPDWFEEFARRADYDKGCK
jgi:ATP-dependent RNA helicase DDX3X